MSDEIIIPILIGVGLSAATGFRIFVPFLVLSIFSLFGDVSLSKEFEWIGTYSALITFGAATLFEIAGYFIPWIDNLLDTIATPTSAIAGAVLMAAVMSDISPLIKWSLAIIAGGGIAGSIQTTTGVIRAGSTATTGGIANPVISTTEAGLALSFSLLAIILPVISLILLFILGIILFKRFRGKFFKKKSDTS
ncbi:MAG: DUF4126 domain-containing protein [Nitrososphaeraceae archaeon]|nr:DUF4126 domain-containing protein [Nitrososphaeraceae archaeon]